MKALGIVFSIFNLLLAGVIVLLAGMDYGRYRGHSLAAFLHEMVIVGLPVDDNEVVESYPSDPTVTKLDGEVTKMVFKQVSDGRGGADLGGEPVKTVNEELARVRGKVKSNVDAQPGEKQKRDKLWSYLQFQARTVVERADYYKKCHEGPIGDALAELDRRFDYVKTPQNRSERPNNKELRQAAAQLLVNLSTDPAWRQRVATVVGLEAYVAAVGIQADTFAQIASDVRNLIQQDQGNFEVSYANAVAELKYQSEELFRANQRLNDLKGVAADREKEVQQRKTEVNQYKETLAKKTGETNAEVARLEALQRDLFAIQQRLGLAQQQNDKLEAELKNKVQAKP
jgi:hypothetical protein